MHSLKGDLSLPLLYRGAGSFVLKEPKVESVQTLFARAMPPDDIGGTKLPLLHPKIKYRSVFLSDFHLGTASCAAKKIVQFLDHIETEYLYLVGDVVDCWQIGGLDLFKIHRQDRSQTRVLQKLMKLERRGVKIVYIPGNHDEYFRDKLSKDLPVNNLAVLFEATHDTVDGRRLLVMHGDSFDEVVRVRRWLSIFGTHVYEKLVRLSAQVDIWRARASINHIFRALGLREEWSLAQALRDVSNEATYGASYIKAATAYLLMKNAEIDKWNKLHPQNTPLKKYNEMICSHTHIPCRMRMNDSPSITLSNTGCWVTRPREESCARKTKKRHPDCTAIVEKCDGRMEHVQWIAEVGIIPIHPRSDGHFDNVTAETLRAKKCEAGDGA